MPEVQRKHRLRNALQQLRGGFIAVAIFSLFVNMCMLVAPIYMLQVYDRVLTSRSIETLVMLTVLAIALMTLSMLVDVCRSRLLVRIGVRLDKNLSSELFQTSLARSLKSDAGQAAQPIRDLETVRSFLTGAGLIALLDAPWTPVYLAILFLFHPLLGLIALGGALLVLLLAITTELVSRKALAYAGAQRRSSTRFLDKLARNVEALHAMGMVRNVHARWAQTHDTGIAWQAAASDRVAWTSSTARLVRVVLQLVLLGTGAWLAIAGTISPGVMIAASIIMGRALAPVEQAIGQWRGFVDARGAFARLKLDLDNELEEDVNRTQLPPPKGEIQVAGLAWRPKGGEKPVLQGISFSLKPGEALGLIGPSGAGKTTLARLLVGLKSPTVGSVRLDGADISDWQFEALGSYIGYLPQNVELLDGTVGENICRFGHPASGAIVAAAKVVGAHDLILKLPAGYDTRIGDGGHPLSSGQEQRVGLARAVYGKAKFLVLDEPNANLDAEGDTALRSAVERMKQRKCTQIIISHKPSILASADKLLALRDGRVELFGPRDEVMAQLVSAVAQSAPNENGERSDRLERRGKSYGG